MEQARAVLESELRAATRKYEDELLAMFDRFPKCHSTEVEADGCALATGTGKSGSNMI